MSSLRFQFEPNQFNSLIDRDKSHKLVASLYSFEHYAGEGKSLFFGLQSWDDVANKADTSIVVVRACPSPPGWGATIDLVPHEHLSNCPKFVIPATEKSRLKTTRPDERVTIELNGEIINELNGEVSNERLAFVAKFIVTDGQNKITATVNATLI